MVQGSPQKIERFLFNDAIDATCDLLPRILQKFLLAPKPSDVWTGVWESESEGGASDLGAA